MNAEECKCCICGAQAVAFWPIIDPDIPEYPYCRRCLDDAKAEMIMQIVGVDLKVAKAIVKNQNKENKNEKEN